MKIAGHEVGPRHPFFLIAGPCVIESPDLCFQVAETMKGITDRLGIPYVFKASFDKANRTSLSGKRGLGLSASMDVFNEIRETTGLPLLTDIHTEEQCAIVAEAADILAHQRDLLVAQEGTREIDIGLADILERAVHPGPAEDARLEAMAHRAALEHLVDEHFHRVDAVALEIAGGVIRSGGEEIVVQAPDAFDGIVEAAGHAAAENGGQHHVGIATDPRLSLRDGDLAEIVPARKRAHARHHSRARAPIRRSGNCSVTAPHAKASAGIP